MKGHIRKRGKRSWAVVLDVGRDQSGRRQQRWHAVQGTRKDAERELTRLVYALNSGGYVTPSKTTLGNYLEKWLADYARANTSGKTYERYVQLIRTHLLPNLGHY